ncbi:hypothetical protein M409DRAFT_30123 [Zasmidium cellare ATCC 36951]|uniref:Uncharacterized protein n=1 Tax=Zasmidium cellare ATCC 36951 TaxID=1080233 RepID=A0A6A6C0N3_ZASCE|nr:uncharacterized protein M409DRAFT_30123 [Zasmidium cellare ATCC 36951]KAF2159372.1 hypothetical protein M409DRAFT_30123 [Zasmidium cellare ATCC 36951]
MADVLLEVAVVVDENGTPDVLLGNAVEVDEEEVDEAPKLEVIVDEVEACALLLLLLLLLVVVGCVVDASSDKLELITLEGDEDGMVDVLLEDVVEAKEEEVNSAPELELSIVDEDEVRTLLLLLEDGVLDPSVDEAELDTESDELFSTAEEEEEEVD